MNMRTLLPIVLGFALLATLAPGLPRASGADGSLSYVVAEPPWVRTPQVPVRAVVGGGVDAVELWFSRWNSQPAMYSRLDHSPWYWSFDARTAGGDGNYSFYSIAIVNHVPEPAPPKADTYVNVDTTKPTSSVQPLPTWINESVFQVRVAAQDNMALDHVDLFARAPHSSTFRFVQTLRVQPYVFTVDVTTLAGGGDGPYLFASRAVDRAGNVEDNYTLDAVGTTVDTHAPSSHIVGTFPAYYTRPDLVVTASVSDNIAVASVELWYQRDGGAWVDAGAGALGTDGRYTWNLPVAEVGGDGHYLLQTRARDQAANIEPLAPDRAVAVAVDTQGPSLTVNAPSPGSFVGSRTVGVAWTALDKVSGVEHYEVSLDGAPFVNIGPSVKQLYRDMADGAHTVVIRAYDRAGNMAEDRVEFTVDTNPFSLTGPYGAAILALVGGLAAVAVALVLLRLRRRRGHRLPRDVP